MTRGAWAKGVRGAAAARAALLRRPQAWRLAAAALLLAIGLLRPSVAWERRLFAGVVIFDITQSMDVTDMREGDKPVSRLAFARQALQRALLQLPCGSQLGLGVFTSYRSYLLLAPVEICANLAELRSAIDHIDNRMAWGGNSEIAKGLHSGIAIARQLPGTPALVFVTDGQEAPPLNPRHRPEFDGKPGAVAGLLVGVGGLLPVPIPKSDPEGRPLGFWGADEVAQTDPYSRGPGGSVAGETMYEDESTPVKPLPVPAPGSEQLSSLREAYLQLLAGETGLGWQRALQPEDMAAALRAPALARPVRAAVDLRPTFALAALSLLLWAPLAALLRRWRGQAKAARTPAFGARRSGLRGGHRIDPRAGPHPAVPSKDQNPGRVTGAS